MLKNIILMNILGRTYPHTPYNYIQLHSKILIQTNLYTNKHTHTHTHTHPHTHNHTHTQNKNNTYTQKTPCTNNKKIKMFVVDVDIRKF